MADTTVQNDQPQAWASGFDDDTKAWVGGMGLDKLPADQALAKVLPMYRGAEQKLGVPADQLLRLPGKDAKPEDWAPVWQKLGRPDKPEGYEIKTEGLNGNGEFLKAATGWFHELGVPKNMAQGLAAKWTEHVKSVQASQEASWNERFEKEVTDLRSEWGDKYDANLDLSKRVQKALGLSTEELQAIESALGPKKYNQTWAKFGAAMGEHKFVGGEGNKEFSQGSIDQQIATLRKSPEYGKDSVEGRRIAQEIYRLTQMDDRPANPVVTAG